MQPPIKPIHEFYINTDPFLYYGEIEGWVTISEHLVHVRWNKYCSVLVASDYKRQIETLVAEAAVLMGQSEVEIR